MAGSGMDHAMDVLEEAWFALGVAVRCPDRAPFWDAVLLTAASPQQAELFQERLEQAKWQGVVPGSTLVMAVPDPGGRRVGSGAATLCALRSLSQKLELEGGTWNGRRMAELRVLLLHAGGDSKRLPWANAVGKAFLVLPFLVHDVSDGPIRSLLDHIVAISVQAVQAFRDKGGIFIMTGDVLPCFKASALTLPENGVCVVTVPASLELAGKHGVIVSHSQDSELVTKVEDLLQKPSEAEMVSKGAVGRSGDVFVDTGMFAVRGDAWRNFIGLSLLEPDPVAEVISSGQELSLYEEIAGAWVPARHQWLRTRPLGDQLITAIGADQLYHYCAHDLTFLHFGTSTEVLDHLAKGRSRRIGQQLSFFPHDHSSYHISTTSVIVASEICGEASVGKESLVYNCSLGRGVVVGSRCVMMGMHIKDYQAQSLWQMLSNKFQKPLTPDMLALTDGEMEPSDGHGFSQDVRGLEHGDIVIPNECCLWEVPVKGIGGDRITLCCGVQDNPKAGLGSPGSGFCGRPWKTFLARRGMQEEDLWVESSSKDLWNAKLFPVTAQGDGLFYALWLLGVIESPAQISGLIVKAWQNLTRLSLADLHDRVDFGILHQETLLHQAHLASSLARASIIDGSFVHNYSKLCQMIVNPAINDGDHCGAAICKELLDSCQSLGQRSERKWNELPASRLYQVQADIGRACGDNDLAAMLESEARKAIIAETAEAVWEEDRQGDGNIWRPGYPCVETCSTNLPVRFDITGGWSDTPPWSLERKGRVLNMAVLLEGAAPVGAKASIKQQLSGLSLSDDAGNREEIGNIRSIKAPLKSDDPFRLVKAALIVTGFTGKSHQPPMSEGFGLEIETWANVPRGSGLGTSSILAAAVVRSLLKLRGTEYSPSRERIAHLVLVLEQLMGTGGGWQDQIGGLYPGIKCTSGFPGRPLLQLSVESISLSPSVHVALQQRMVVMFTGQVRLAVTVLERVVHRYLQRDALLVHAINRLSELAGLGQECLLSGDLDALGRIMLETWKINQELDPFCSNTLVDSLFRKVEHLTCGYKLVGAGGGGFGILMAKDAVAAELVKAILVEFRPPVQVYDWAIAQDDEY